MDLAEKSIPVFMYDQAIPTLPQEHKKFYFYNIVICGKSNQRGMKDIGRLMRGHGHLGKNLIMKIDIEGYEYPAHDAMTDEEISCFTQITCAVHDLQDFLTNFGRHLSVRRFLQKIFNQMHCVHVHAKNVGWQAEAHGLKDPLLLGLTFVRKDKGTTFVPTNDLRDNKDTEFNRRKK